MKERTKFQVALAAERSKFEKLLAEKHEEMEAKFADEMKKTIEQLQKDCESALEGISSSTNQKKLINECLQEGFKSMKHVWMPKAGTILRKSSNFFRSCDKISLDDHNRLFSPKSTPQATPKHISLQKESSFNKIDKKLDMTGRSLTNFDYLSQYYMSNNDISLTSEPRLLRSSFDSQINIRGYQSRNKASAPNYQRSFAEKKQ